MKDLTKRTLLIIIFAGLFSGLLVDAIYISLRKQSFYETEKNSIELSLNALSENIGVFVKVGDIHSIHRNARTFFNFIDHGRLVIFDNNSNVLHEVASHQAADTQPLSASKKLIKINSDILYTNENVGHITLSKPRSVFRLNLKDYLFCASLLALFLLAAFLLAKAITDKWKAADQIRKQVAHDIASPLSALNLAAKTLPDQLSAQKEMFLEVAKRIHSISLDLKSPSTVVTPPAALLEKVQLSKSVESIVQEKLIEFSKISDLDFNFENDLSSNDTLLANEATFKRVLSNLLNNSVESLSKIQHKKSISLRTGQHNGSLTLSIQDNGCGIPEQILKKVCENGFSSGKNKGSGLGLYHAKESVQSWGGRLLISSEVNRGTYVNLVFPKNQSPN